MSMSGSQYVVAPLSLDSAVERPVATHPQGEAGGPLNLLKHQHLDSASKGSTAESSLRTPGACLLAVLLTVALILISLNGYAGEAQPLIKDPVIEARMAALSSQLRCLVCQGQSIAESGSGFANDVRREMRREMENGRTDAQVVDFLVQRYGDFILFRPPVKGTTLLLWFGPLALLLLALTVLFMTLRRRRQKPVGEQLSQAEIRRAETLLGEVHHEDDKV